MKARLEWFKFYPGRWRGSRRVALMTPAQKGVYMDLLCMAWEEGSIPDDPAELAFHLRLPLKVFRPLWEGDDGEVPGRRRGVREAFMRSPEGDGLVSRPLEEERAGALARSEKGRNAANTRWGDDASALPEEIPSNAIKSKKKEEEKEQEADAFDLEAIYRAYPGKQGKAKGIEALRKTVKSQHQYELVLKAAANYSDEERKHKASGSKAFRPEVPYFSTWVNQRRWEDFEQKPNDSGPRQLGLAERALEREAKERGFASHEERIAAEGRR